MAGLAHLGVGFAAKRAVPEVPLGLLLPCSMALDILSIGLTFAGIESHGNVPYSHGLLGSLIISAVVFPIALLISRNIRIGIVLSLVVFSHWILDFMTWPMKAVYADAEGVPVFFDNSLKIGIGLHSNIVAALIVEFLFLGAGVAVYIVTLEKIRKNNNSSNMQLTCRGKL
ncbi:MAG: hypothetical protein JW904_11415 [Spirochaetales bacterium]|nr:hypothetical protein [Spirochaetales bacterium]